jgi:hypothetical protein
MQKGTIMSVRGIFFAEKIMPLYAEAGLSKNYCATISG